MNWCTRIVLLSTCVFVRLGSTTPCKQLVGETMLGIDLGTTYSVAAVCHRGNVTITQVRAGALCFPDAVPYLLATERTYASVNALLRGILLGF